MYGLPNPITSIRIALTENYINPVLEACHAIKNTAIEHSSEILGMVRDQFYQDCADVKTYAERRIAPSLPQKSGAANIALLEQRITVLEDTPNREALTTTTRTEVSERKTALITEYLSICGRYYRDPSSQIHIASQTLKALEHGYNTTAATPFDRTLAEPTSEEMRPVFETYQAFTALKQRSEAILNEIRAVGSIIQSDPELLAALKAEKQELKLFQHALCGAHKADPTSQLYKASREYKKSLTANDGVASAALLEIYKSYEDQRKTVDARLLLVNQMLTAPASLTLDSIITQKIEAVVTPIRAQIETQRGNVGVDWKTTAFYATTGLMPFIAYAVAPTPAVETSPIDFVIL